MDTKRRRKNPAPEEGDSRSPTNKSRKSSIGAENIGKESDSVPPRSTQSENSPVRKMTYKHSTLLWCNEMTDRSACKHISMVYMPKSLSEEASILLEDDMTEIHKDITSLFPKSVAQCSKLLKTCLICDEKTSDDPNQVIVMDTEVVPGLLDSHYFEETGVFILHYEFLLGKTITEQCAIVSQVVHAAIEDTMKKNRRVVIYIPRLERFWGCFDSSIQVFIEEKLMLVSTRPILIISTTCWTLKTLPYELDEIFKGPASASHEVTFPSDEKINTVIQKILPNHQVFVIYEYQSEEVVKMLKRIKENDLPELRKNAVSFASGKRLSAILTLYRTLNMYCDWHGGDWENKEHLDTSMYFLLERIRGAIGAIL